MLPVSRIWDETLEFVQREVSLLLPVSMATMGLGQAVMYIASYLSQIRAYSEIASTVSFLGMILTFGGLMTVMFMALRPGSSVGEALRRGFGRLPGLGLLVLILMGVMILLLMPLAGALVSSGVDFSNPEKIELPLYAGLYLGMVGAFLVWVSLRAYAVFGLLVDTDMRAIDAARRSYDLTRGHLFVLLGIALTFLLVGFVVDSATQMVIGSIFAALGRLLAMPLLPVVMVALVGGMASAAISMVTTSFAAFLYRHLSQQ